MKKTFPKIFYRYRSVGKSLGYLLSEIRGELWFSTHEYLNDPFDGLSRILPLEKEIQVPSFNSESENEIQKAIRKAGWAIACFSETSESITMWAHYADFNGVCLGYDSEELKASISRLNEGHKWPFEPKGVFDKVNYVNQMPKEFKDYEEGLFTKIEDWKAEKEWRTAYLFNKFYGISKGREVWLTENCLKEVIFGPKTETHTMFAIFDCLRERAHSISFFILKLNKKISRLSIEPYDLDEYYLHRNGY